MAELTIALSGLLLIAIICKGISPACILKALLELRLQPVIRWETLVKYYKYGYEMNDSMYADKVSEEVERINAMYDYTRNQKVAQQKMKEAQNENHKREVVVTVFFLFLLLLQHPSHTKSLTL